MDKARRPAHQADMTYSDVSTLFARAEAEYRAARPANAELLLAEIRRLIPNNPQLWHLTALAAERDGRHDDALAAFRKAAALQPSHPGLLVDLADRLGEHDSAAALMLYSRAITIETRLVGAYLGRGRLMHRLGRYEEARADLIQVFQLAPDLLAGWLARGAMERDAGVPAAAVIAYDRALALVPDNRIAQHGRARLALELGEAQAAARFAALAAAEPENHDFVMSEAEAAELAGEANAHESLARLVNLQPRWAEGQALLARMLWEAGAPNFDTAIRSAIAAAPGDETLHAVLIETLAGVDRFADAAEAANHAASATGKSRFALIEAGLTSQAGDHAPASVLFERLPLNVAGRALEEARHRVRLGDLDRADTLADTAIATDPWDVPTWALRDLIWRARSDERSTWLHGQPGLISSHQLAVDEAKIAAIAAHLRELHNRARHPVGQSMREGTQTRGRLLVRQHPLIAELRGAIGEAVMAHWNGLPQRDDRHPLLRHRMKAPTMSGSWSVRLTNRGHHVAHIHPQGLLSSASYWVVPSTSSGEEGWLEVGRPPADLGLDLPPIARFAPEPGTLALFPSTIFHGTRPFAAGERITVAFDISAG